jgi:hypothetical protein
MSARRQMTCCRQVMRGEVTMKEAVREGGEEVKPESHGAAIGEPEFRRPLLQCGESRRARLRLSCQ